MAGTSGLWFVDRLADSNILEAPEISQKKPLPNCLPVVGEFVHAPDPTGSFLKAGVCW
jgi:hypothetical protein